MSKKLNIKKLANFRQRFSAKKFAGLVAVVLAAGLGLTTLLTARSFAQSGSGNVGAVDTKLANAGTETSADGSSRLVDENVYVFTKSDGSVRQILYSDWTKNFSVDEYSLSRNDQKKTPIDLKITYLLDGQDVSAKDLAGKSGRVTVRFAYTNKEMASGYYIPYAVVTGLMLSNDHFSNIEATNAKVINDGARTIIAGVVLPGMQENLGLSGADFELPSYLEFTADAKDFQLDMTVSIATNEVFKDIDVSGLNSLDALEAQLQKMANAMDQLVGGSSELAQGIETLYEKASALPDGVEKLYAGSLELGQGAKKLDAGVKKLQSTVKEKLVAGATQIVGENYANSTALANGVAALVNSTVDTVLAQYNPAFTPLLPAFAAFNLPHEALTHANYADSLTKWAAAMDNATVAAALTAAGQTPATLKAQFTTLNTQLSNLDKLSASAKAYTTGVNQLVAGINGELLNGIAELSTGATQLSTGAGELSSGIATLNDSAPALVSGINQLRDGSVKLSSGLKQFNEEAIRKLVNFYNGDIKPLINRIQDIAYVARNYSSTTKYIYRTDAIK